MLTTVCAIDDAVQGLADVCRERDRCGGAVREAQG
jgi:hypothetical protein